MNFATTGVGERLFKGHPQVLYSQPWVFSWIHLINISANAKQQTTTMDVSEGTHTRAAKTPLGKANHIHSDSKLLGLLAQKQMTKANNMSNQTSHIF